MYYGCFYCNYFDLVDEICTCPDEDKWFSCELEEEDLTEFEVSNDDEDNVL